MSKSLWFTSLSAGDARKNLIPLPRYCAAEPSSLLGRHGNSGVFDCREIKTLRPKWSWHAAEFCFSFLLNGIKEHSSSPFASSFSTFSLLYFSCHSSASAINQACNTPRRQSKAKMQVFLLLLLLSTFFVLIKFHKLYAKHYSVSPHSAEWGGYSVLILRLRLLLVFLMQLSTPSHKSLLGSLPSCGLSLSLALSFSVCAFKLFLIRLTLETLPSRWNEVFFFRSLLAQSLPPPTSRTGQVACCSILSLVIYLPLRFLHI